MAPDGLSSTEWSDTSDPKQVADSEQAAKSSYVVRVRGLVIEMLIGVHDHEKEAPQRVRISVELHLDMPEGGFNDTYSKVYCYEVLVERIKALAAKGHVILVETFAERVGGIAFEDERIRTVRVDLDKLDICPEAEAVGATIERRR